MEILAGYENIQLIYTSSVVSVYRGRRTETQQPVILKMLTSEYPSPKDIARLKHEFNLLKELALPSVIRAYALEKYHNRYILVLEDFSGLTLSHFLEKHTLTIEFFLELAIQLSQILHELHHAKIIHKDINPENILISENGEQVKLIDFSIATQLAWEEQELKNPDVLEGTLPYISPEQTSRMNRAIDHRTDFYSLGVTFYQMLTGQLPFRAKDAIEWVHCHIAKQPHAPHEIRPDTPLTLSTIIIKLLAKAAEDRYNTAYGLKADLEQCLQLWRQHRDIPPFKLGQQDRASTFQIPQKLYGREAEVQQLLETFERASQGRRELLFVTGYAGIGKSSLVNEIQKPIIKQRGYFTSGKFQQFQYDIPYSAIITALRGLVQQILTESQNHIEMWHNVLLDALESNAQVIVSVIPEIELLIGEQPPPPELPPAESKNRFELALCDFIQVFAQEKHPLVIFLDDLQWADIPSLNFLTQLLQNKLLSHYLIIANYRDNEVKTGHPLIDFLEILDKLEISYHQLLLKSLGLESLQKLVNDTLYTTLDTKPLAQLLLEKTGGNPFFVNVFLTTLYQEKHITFDKIRREWVWNIDIIETLSITDNVVDLLESKITKLPSETQEFLKTAACIGNQFDLSTLAKLCEKSPTKIAKALWSAMEEHLISCHNENYKLAMIDEEFINDKQMVWYQFSHDRVQQAATHLLSESQTKLINLKLGRLLQRILSPEEQEEKIFDIACHFNNCLDLLTSPEEKIAITKLNLQAAKKAKNSAAFYTAITYFEKAIELMSKERTWEKYPDIAFEMYAGFAECQHLIGKFKEADHYFEQIMEYAKTPYQRAKIRLLQLTSYSVQQELEKAIDYGLNGLKILGIHFDKHPSKLQIIGEFIQVKYQLRNKTINDIVDMPTIENPEKILIMDLLQKISYACYMLPNPELMTMKTLVSIKFSLKNGNTLAISTAYCYLGIASLIFLNDLDKAIHFVSIGKKLNEKFNDPRMIAYVDALFEAFINHWRTPYSQCVENLLKTAQIARQTGDIIAITYTISSIPELKWCSSEDLTSVKAYIKKNIPIIEFTKNTNFINNVKTGEMLIDALIGDISFQKFQKRIEEFLEGKLQYTLPTPYFAANLFMLQGAYIFRDFKLAKKVLDSFRPSNVKRIKIIFIYPEFQFYLALIKIAIYSQQNPLIKQLLLKQLKNIAKQFSAWAKRCPANFESKYLLISCGIELLQDHTDKAIRYYEDCVASARNNSLINIEAFAHEIVARHFLSHKQPKSAKAYLQEACFAYQQWGAHAKVAALYTEFPSLLGQQFVPTAQATHHTREIMNLSLTGSLELTQLLDLGTVMKSAQAIASHVQLVDLLRTLIKIVIENAGAERGVLFLVQDEQLIVQAESTTSDPVPIVMQNEPLKNRSDVSFAILQYVQRAQEPVVLGDAANKGSYTRDPYVAQRKPLSVLCMPILHQARLLGVLYLENNLARDAFTKNRIEILRLLSSQIAISLENARLYAAYDQFVPHEFLDLLGKRSIVDIRLGDHVQKDMAVLFSDIRGFTKISEQLTPSETFQFMNEYLGYMEPIIKENGGFIDKYIGDAIMALFPTSTEAAVTASITMQRQIDIFNQTRINRGLSAIRVGIGINSGSLMLGTLGSTHRIETSVISDAVNVAARIQELTKEYDSRILIGDSVYFQLKDPSHFECRFVCRSQIRGKQQKMNIWEVYASDPEDLRIAKRSIAERYDEAIILYYQGYYEDALPIFQECLKRLPSDKVIQIYINSCHSFIHK